MISDSNVPTERIHLVRDAEVTRRSAYVLYWMIANRRTGWNFALQRAIDWARALELPLLVFEPLRVDHRWASDRFHRFVLDGMDDNLRCLAPTPIAYYPWVEPAAGGGAGLLASLSERAALVITDDTPMFFLPDMVTAAARHVDVRMEAVDSVGILPFRTTDGAFATAHGLRRYLQRELPPHIDRLPLAEPTAGLHIRKLETELTDLANGFVPTPAAALREPRTLAALPIDHRVAPTGAAGGSDAARIRLQRFAGERIADYADDRNHPDDERSSGLSPYLHFGHISSHEIFATVAAEEYWTAANLAESAGGARRGWWGMSAGAEAYLDQLITWRELGVNMCHHCDDYDRFSSLPAWARKTLNEHRGDERPHVYDLAACEAADTHDELWNAAQRQLIVEGRMHNYLRMLWGKKILEWSESPEAALAVMIELNNKYALDGRDPNSYSGIFWTLGRYDRAWGPERPIFGKVRTMTSDSARRKLRLRKYLERYRQQP